MVRPINSKRKLFAGNKEHKENEPDLTDSYSRLQIGEASKSSSIGIGHTSSPSVIRSLPKTSRSPLDNDVLNILNAKTHSNLESPINYSKNQVFVNKEDVSTCNSLRGVMPMSERQQIALVMQMSSPTEKCDYHMPSPKGSNTPNTGRGVNKRNERGETPLHIAAIKGDTEKIAQLISKSADVNAVDYASWTPLHEACNRGYYSICKLLIDAGADVSAKGLDDDTPLHDACVNNHYKIVKLLVKCGADVTAVNSRGKTPKDVCWTSSIEKALNKNLSDISDSSDDEFNSSHIDTRQIEHIPHTICTEEEMSRRTPPVSKMEDKSNTNGSASINPNTSISGSGNVNNSTATTSSSGGGPASPRVTLILPKVPRTPEKGPQRTSDKPSNENSDDPYEFKCAKDENASASSEETESIKKEGSSPPADDRGHSSEHKRPREDHNQDEDDEAKKKKRKEEPKEAIKCMNRMAARPTGSLDKSNKSSNRPVPSNTAKQGSAGAASINLSNSVTDRKSPGDSTANSPKSSSGKGSEPAESDEETKGESSSGAPKVPPLKIVLSSVGSTEQEPNGMQNNKNGSNRQMHYVVNSNSNEEKDSVDIKTEPNIKVEPETMDTSSDSGNTSTATTSVSEGPSTSTVSNSMSSNTTVHSSSINSNTTTNTSSIFSTTSNTSNTPGNSSNIYTSSSNSISNSSSNISVNSTTTVTSLSGSNANDTSANGNNSNASSSHYMSSGSNIGCSSGLQTGQNAGDKTGAARVTRSRGGGNSNSGSSDEQIQDIKNEDSASSSTEVVHPRKRKIKIKVEEPEPAPSNSFEPQQPAITNCYEMFLTIRKQIEHKRKLLFPVTPKPPQGFKDYLLNRCSYILAGNNNCHFRMATAPSTLCQTLKDLFTQQEKDRYKLRVQHQIEKEKLVLSVEQEILRVHGRAARALANQALPFSVCTILKDEEVYNVITPEQEEKDRNARSRYNGRHFLSWLQEVDDKWEKIKEAMMLRHHNEAESLHAVQKMDWEWKMKELAMCDNNSNPTIDTEHVPMVKVSDFDLLPA